MYDNRLLNSKFHNFAVLLTYYPSLYGARKSATKTKRNGNSQYSTLQIFKVAFLNLLV